MIKPEKFLKMVKGSMRSTFVATAVSYHSDVHNVVQYLRLGRVSDRILWWQWNKFRNQWRPDELKTAQADGDPRYRKEDRSSAEAQRNGK